MAEIELNYDSIKTIIQCNTNEKMNDIYNKYLTKIGKNINDIYFVYDGNKIQENLQEITFTDLANNIDKKRAKMNILVYERNINKEKTNICKLKEIICSKCGENIRILIENYKVKLFGCKNMHHLKYI